MHTDGTLSWETVADAGEVDHDDDDDEENDARPLAASSSNGTAKNVFQRMTLDEPLTTTKFELGERHVKRLINGCSLTMRKLQLEGFTNPMCVVDKEGTSPMSRIYESIQDLKCSNLNF